ncbi:hypothetical protein NM688_g6578 [Phlebia brevispora]|uniref:Uncharacterized protein n=1 Tax=Phlebia brevispora TaxID=194682 RepID=A0ACC1SEH7_9APHY|nr:hypothetical protein NM688_g6578 [Phlebia brevispora]
MPGNLSSREVSLANTSEILRASPSVMENQIFPAFSDSALQMVEINHNGPDYTQFGDGTSSLPGQTFSTMATEHLYVPKDPLNEGSVVRGQWYPRTRYLPALHVLPPYALERPQGNSFYPTPNTSVGTGQITGTETTSHVPARVSDHSSHSLISVSSEAESSPVIRHFPSIENPKLLVFVCGGLLGIRLDLVAQGDLQDLLDPDYRGFFDGYGEKVSYKIIRTNKAPYIKLCRTRRMKRKQPVYITRSEIIQQVTIFTNNFIEADAQFYTDPTFAEWSSAGFVGLENFVLVGLEKISKASVHPIYRYRPSSGS